MSYSLMFLWLNDFDLNSILRNQIRQASEKLILILIKCLSKRLKIRQIHTIYHITKDSFLDSFLVFFRNNLVDDKTHNPAICYKRSKAICQYTNSGRTEITQLQVETATVLQSIIKEPFWRKLFSRYIGSILSPFYIFQHRRSSDYILVI